MADHARALKNLERALAELESYAAIPVVNRRDKAGLIQAFEFTFELFWKLFQKLAPEAGLEAASPSFRSLCHAPWMIYRLLPLVLVLCCGASSVLACPADLDPDFGVHGVAEDSRGLRGEGVALATLPDGDIVMAGVSGSPQPFLTRYRSDGWPRTSFAEEGTVVIQRSGGFHAVAVQEDGRIVAAGTLLEGPGSVFFLARFLGSGELDASFGDDGVVRTQIGDSEAWINDFVILGDGRIVAAGTAGVRLSHWSAIVAAYLPDGTLDPDFGEDGIVSLSPQGESAVATAVSRFDDDSVVIGAILDDAGDPMLFKLRPDGTFDESFANDGVRIRRTRFYEELWDVVVDSEGRILVSGSTTTQGKRPYRLPVRRYLPDGTVDRTYGSRGKARLGFARPVVVRRLLVGDDDSATVAGFYLSGASALIVRLDETGHRDGTFARRGVSRFQAGSRTDVWGASLQPDGGILVTGEIGSWPGIPYVARLEGGQIEEGEQCLE